MALFLTAALSLLIISASAAQPTEKPDLEALLHIPLDGDCTMMTPTDDLSPAGGGDLAYVEGRSGQAASLGEGDFIDYAGVPAVDPDSGTIEFWGLPHFANRDLDDHYYLRFLTEDGESGLDINFAALHCGPRALMFNGDRATNVHADFQSHEDEWNHIAVTWDTLDRDLSCLRLYVNGRIRAYEDFRPMQAPTRLIVGRESADEATNAKAEIDEVYAYNRCLTEMQVAALYECEETGAERVAVMRERIAADDAMWRGCMETLRNERSLAMVTGRTIHGWSEDRFGLIGMDRPPEVNEHEVENVDLSQYDLLIFPGGGGFDLTDAGVEALQAYIRAGGGYVGVCAGAWAARRYGLIERDFFPFRERGWVEVTLREHPVTEGYHLSRKLALRHDNGPFIEAGDVTEIPVMYKAGPPYACVVAKKLGEGRVVIFSAHPEGEDETRRLTRNAILWAAKVTGTDAE